MIKNSFLKVIKRDRYLLLLMLPAFAYFLVFCYLPMIGVIISFQDFSPGKGFFNSQWVGFKWFVDFFNSYYFIRLLRNTFLLALYPLLFGFAIPIIFAIVVTEIKNSFIKKTVQTVSYLPYFISTVVVVGMLVNFLSPNDGIVNIILSSFGMDKINFFGDPRYFRTIYTISVIWQNFGFSSIVYIAAIMAIDVELFDSSKLDGANKFQEIFYIVLPSILPTITVMLLLNIGNILNVGFERVYLMYNPAIYETSDVIPTFIYRKGIETSNYGYATAVGLFNSVINFIILLAANAFSRKFNKLSLW